MHKPFDLEAAKRGEPIEVLDAGVWRPAYFVGLSFAGVPFIQKILGSGRSTAAFEFHEAGIRMGTPKNVTVRYRVAIFSDGERRWPVAAGGENDVVSIPKNRYFIEWIHTDWQEAEVEIPQ